MWYIINFITLKTLLNCGYIATICELYYQYQNATQNLTPTLPCANPTVTCYFGINLSNCINQFNSVCIAILEVFNEKKIISRFKINLYCVRLTRWRTKYLVDFVLSNHTVTFTVTRIRYKMVSELQQNMFIAGNTASTIYDLKMLKYGYNVCYMHGLYVCMSLIREMTEYRRTWKSK